MNRSPAPGGRLSASIFITAPAASSPAVAQRDLKAGSKTKKASLPSE